jgi:hypothetical protein
LQLLTVDGKQVGPQNVRVYSTAIELSNADLVIYRMKVHQMLGGRANEGLMQFDKGFDCIKLIKDYGKRLSTP